MEASRQPDGTPPYQYLRGRSGLFTKRRKTYLGEDHLLVLTHGTVITQFQRFYYRDVEALSCTRTRTWILVALALGLNSLLLLAAGVALLAQGMPMGFAVVLLTLGAVLLLAAAINLLRGPTCVTTLHTGVHALRLTCFSRWRQARRAMDAIRERVHLVQGRLSPEALSQGMGGEDAFATLVVDQADTPVRPGAASTGTFQRYGLTAGAMVLLMAFGVACCVVAVVFHLAILAVCQAFLAAAMAATVASLACQRNTDVPKSVQTFTWWTFFELVVVYMLYGGMAQFTTQLGTDAQLSAIGEQGFVAFARGFHLVVAVLTGITGCVGLLVVLTQRPKPPLADVKQPPPTDD